jgi:hypothetical protein
MEASENAEMPLKENGETALHRIDLERVTATPASAKHAAGLSRLELMITAVMPRLVGEPPNTRSV